MARVLTVDVGNTFTNLGLFEGDQLLGSYEATTPERCTADEAAEVARRALRSIAPNSPAAAAGILACVVPALTDVWTRALGAVCGARALVVGPGLKSGLKMRYDDPAEVGADRVADAVAAREIFGAPCVVVNLGTTTNFEVLDASGAFAGGIIAPGVELGAESIAVAAARLPKIELRTPARVIGRNTREAMQSGIVLGEVARIDGLLDAVLAELAGAGGAAAGSEAGPAAAATGDVPIVVTGTNAPAMAALLKHEAQARPTLTLEGLNLIYRRNRR